MTRPLILCWLCWLLLSACSVDTDLDRTDEDVGALHGGAPHRRLIQPGAGVQLLEVTDDNYAIYQLGQQVFAAALDHQAPAPELIGNVPAGNTAFVYQVGRVAFVWTNPDRTLPGFGVSPLMIWTARNGAHLASEASAIGTLATWASADGEVVLFTASSPADGASGDLVVARADLSHRTTIAAGIAMAFPSGPCVPRAAFVGGDADLVAVYCLAASTATATLSRWHHGARRDFAEPVFAPPRLWVDNATDRVATLLATSQFPVTLDRRLDATVVTETSAVNVFFGGDGATLYATRPSPTAPRSLFRGRGKLPPRLIADLLGLHTFAFGSVGFSTPITSPDGRKLLYFDGVDPSVGVATNVLLADARGVTPPVTLDSSGADAVFGVPFTRDSRFALYARFDTTSFAVGAMFAATAAGTRQFSDASGWQWDAAFDATITYNDNTILDVSNFQLSTADLKAVDLARPTLAPKLIAEQANVTYFASHRGTGVAYVIDQGPGAGLYVASVF